ncbi:MAG: hypothetical protein NTX75_14580 [Proteobacteria bacterium]|nr:hypothetical protein [Pseudomonadota bacterium]
MAYWFIVISGRRPSIIEREILMQLLSYDFNPSQFGYLEAKRHGYIKRTR